MRPEVKTIIARLFRLSEEGVGSDPSPDTIPVWDSLGHLQLVTALETAFGLRFQVREIQTMDSGSKIEAVLRARGR